MLEKCRELLGMKEGFGIKGKSGITPGLKDPIFFCFLTFPALQSNRETVTQCISGVVNSSLDLFSGPIDL